MPAVVRLVPMTRSVAALAFLGMLSAAACNNGSSSTLPAPSPAMVSDSFTGTVQPQGSQFDTFQVGAAGTVSVTLTTAGPPSTIFMGLGLGVPATGANGQPTCSLVNSANAQAGTTPQIGASTTTAGTLCVSIYDEGNQTGPVDFSITITHP